MIDRQREKNVRRNRRACIVPMAAGVLMQTGPAVLEATVQHPLGHLRADVFGQVVDARVHGAGGQEAGVGIVRGVQRVERVERALGEPKRGAWAEAAHGGAAEPGLEAHFERFLQQGGGALGLGAAGEGVGPQWVVGLQARRVGAADAVQRGRAGGHRVNMGVRRLNRHVILGRHLHRVALRLQLDVALAGNQRDAFARRLVARPQPPPRAQPSPTS